MRAKGDVNNTVIEQESRALAFPLGIKCHRILSRYGHRSSDHGRTSGFFRACRNIERMKLLDEARAIVFQRFGCHIENIRREIDHRCAGDPVLRIDVATIYIAAGDGRHTIREKAGLPERQRVRARIGIRIEGIHAVMFGCDIHDIVDNSVDCHVGDIERLGKDIAENRLREELAEIRGVDVRWRQDRLAAIHVGPLVVVPRRGHSYLGSSGNGRSEEDRRKHTKQP